MKLYQGLVILVCCTFFIHADEKSQNDHQRAKRLAIGFHLNEFDDDFGCGVNLTTPWFGNGHAAFRLNGNVVFSKLLNWQPYGAMRMGFLGGTSMIQDFCRFYGEGGMQLIIENRELSEDILVVGGYGHFGFEFFVDNKNYSRSYFIELGTSGIYAKADKISDEPLYFNGFCTGVGVRFYL